MNRGLSFHFYVSISVSFTKVLYFSKYRSFISLVKFFPRYFILFDAILNRIVCLLSLLIVHYQCIGNNRFLVSCNFAEFIWQFQEGFFWWRLFSSIISFANSDSFISLPIWIPFISCVIAVTRTSNTMLSRSCDSWNPSFS